MKTCSKCGKTKSQKEFTKRPSSKDGFCSWCKQCNKEAIKKRYAENPEYRKQVKSNKYLREFGITLEDYNLMYEEQNGNCAICKEHSSTHDRLLAIDHCHTTGKIRKLLCKNCNLALGLIKENKETLNTMISYLEEHND